MVNVAMSERGLRNIAATLESLYILSLPRREKILWNRCARKTEYIEEEDSSYTQKTSQTKFTIHTKCFKSAPELWPLRIETSSLRHCAKGMGLEPRLFTPKLITWWRGRSFLPATNLHRWSHIFHQHRWFFMLKNSLMLNDSWRKITSTW